MSTRTTAADLESDMRKVSALVSLIAILLMAAGFMDMVATRQVTSFPGASALPVPQVLDMASIGNMWGLWAMSVGILLLALLPMLRVFLSLWFFARDKDWLDMGVSLIVFLELLSSLHLGG